MDRAYHRDPDRRLAPRVAGCSNAAMQWSDKDLWFLEAHLHAKR